ncbi:MAG TPA: hypothetical protein DCP06_07240 [Lachnospiraceae bacterium]|nr:hypothetical protein [Lachnospiraceae bacterium]
MKTPKKSIRWLIIAFALMIVITMVVMFLTADKYKVYFHLTDESYTDMDIELTGEGKVDVIENEINGAMCMVTLSHRSYGDVQVKITCTSSNDPNKYFAYYTSLYATKTGLIFGPDMNFNGYQIVTGIIALFLGFITVLMFRGFLLFGKASYYSYDRLLCLGLSIYFFLLTLMYLVGTIAGVIYNTDLNARVIWIIAIFVNSLIVLGMIPFIIIFGICMTTSNIQLIRHEGFKFSNTLGILISALMLIGSVVIILSVMIDPVYLSPDPKDVMIMVFRSITSSIFVYFICIFISSEFCLFAAARHKISYDQDYIIILGCGIRKDGTLYPLLKGRADRAAAFYKKQLETTGKKAIIIPSGGKGTDEIMPEGEAIKNYLLSIGLPDDIILPETNSKNTYENISFSKKIMDAGKKPYKVVISTTNYHVFRSGMLATAQGLNVSGIGSKTKWYFWPNAQVRDFIGLVVGKWKVHLVFCVLMILISVNMANMGNVFEYLIKNV